MMLETHTIVSTPRIVALIPTNSLMQIEDKMGNKLNEAIYVLRGNSRIASSPKKTAIMPYLDVFENSFATTFVLKFDRQKNEGSRIDLGAVVKALLDNHAYDLFLSQMAFTFNYQGQPTYIYMENVPAPFGTKLEADMKRSRKKFLKRHGYEVNTSAMQFRMLRFSIARTRGGHLDIYDTYTEKFCKWLSMESYGLIGSLNEKELKRSIFRGGDYTFYDGVWKEDFKEE